MIPSKRFKTKKVGDVTAVCFCESRILDALEIEELGGDLYRLLEGESSAKLLLDFSAVQFLSSAMLGKLISLNGKVKARGGLLKLCGIQPNILEVFRICCLDRVFDIKADELDALATRSW